MGTKITDIDYLKLTDLAYLAFELGDSKYDSIAKIFTEREDILKDADS